MAVKILIKRKFKSAEFKAGCKLITKARFSAMKQKGYISSETLSDIEDPYKLVIVSMWQNLESWNRWAQSDLRIESEDEDQKILEAISKMQITLKEKARADEKAESARVRWRMSSTF